ncbi:hypothetical protein MCETE4_01551 [Acidimicrobiia bacterium]
MSILSALSSHRFLVGSLGAALGLTAATAPVIVDTANAAQTDNTNTTADISTQSIGTYESCTAYFGLFKENSNLANFDIVNNTADPEPVIANSQQAGPTLVPVVTLTDESNNIIECTPALGWTDEATWESDYMEEFVIAILGNTVSYPGTGFWLLPAVGYTLQYFDTALALTMPFTAVTGTLRFESNLAGVSVISSMVNLPTTAPTFDASNVAYQSSYWASALNIVATAPTGSAEQAELFDAIVSGFVNGPTMCDNSGGLLVPDANYASLIATLEALLPLDDDVNCEDIEIVGSILVDAAVQIAKVANAPATVTVGDPTPTTTTVVADEPVTPAFAG